MFSTLYGTYFSFQLHFKMSSAICFNLDQSKISSSGNGFALYHIIPNFNDLEKKNTSENIVGKGENAGHQHFLLFQQCFIPFPSEISIFQ